MDRNYPLYSYFYGFIGYRPMLVNFRTYSVIAPKTIRSNSEYSVVVSHHQADDFNGQCNNVTLVLSLHVNIRILGRSDQGSNNGKLMCSFQTQKH